jgi:hypothetical protein
MKEISALSKRLSASTLLFPTMWRCSEKITSMNCLISPNQPLNLLNGFSSLRNYEKKFLLFISQKIQFLYICIFREFIKIKSRFILTGLHINIYSKSKIISYLMTRQFDVNSTYIV